MGAAERPRAVTLYAAAEFPDAGGDGDRGWALARGHRRLAQPLTALEALQSPDGLIVIDEVQRAPALFPVLRVLLDRSPRNGQFLLLGSASPALQQAGESLLGRLEVIAQRDLHLDALYVVYPGSVRYAIAEGIEAVPLAALIG